MQYYRINDYQLPANDVLFNFDILFLYKTFHLSIILKGVARQLDVFSTFKTVLKFMLTISFFITVINKFGR